MPNDHRGLSSTLYMVKPSTANTVAPTLALSQKVELVRSAWLTCLLNREGEERVKCKDRVQGRIVNSKETETETETTMKRMKITLLERFSTS